MKNFTFSLVPLTVIAFVAVLSCLVYALLLLSTERRKGAEALEIQSDELRSFRNLLDQETASRQTIELEARDLRAYRASADPELRRLGELAAKYRGQLQAATVFRSETRIPKLESEARVSRPDSAAPGPSPELSLSATIQDSAGWFSAQVRAGIDSAGRARVSLEEIRIREAYEVIFRRERSGFLGLKRENITEIKSLNAYATTTGLRSWRAPDPDRRKPFLAGATVSLLAVGIAKFFGVL